MRKWQVGYLVDRTLDESVESSLERIKNAFLNRKNWDDVLLKRQDAIERQKDRAVDSKPCLGMSFSTGHYPPALLNLLLECGGVSAQKKIQFNCFYNTKRTNANTIVISREGKWIFNGCCFGCQTLKDVAWNAVKDYFINIKVSSIYPLSPNHKIQKLDQWLG
jgi:hypothetical protein